MNEVWAKLSCDHLLLWDDPDEDVNASFLCRDCGDYNCVVEFIDGRAT